MSAAWQFYITTLIVFSGVNIVAAWSLNLQYGFAGILNFAFIIFQAIGAYVAAVLSLGPASASGGFQHYILGGSLPWPLPLLAAGISGGLLAFLVGLFALRPTRSDYQGMVLLTVSLIAGVIVQSEVGLFNGDSGLVGVPRPLDSQFHFGLVQFGWFYSGLTAVVVLVVYIFMRRLTHSPWSRQVRAMRDNPVAIQALGVDVRRRRMEAFVLGGVLAGISGGLVVQFIGAWAPAGWTIGETFIFFVCVVVGGLGSNRGAAIGAFLVLTVVVNGLQYLPIFSYGVAAQALQTAGLGLLIVAFMWLKPRGLLPPRRATFGPTHAEHVTASSERDSGRQ